MPKILDRLVSQIEAQWKPKSSAYPIAIAALQRSGNLKKGSAQATAKWVRRWNMSPWDRAKDRASKISGRSTSQYSYNSNTNRATLKHWY